MYYVYKYVYIYIYICVYFRIDFKSRAPDAHHTRVSCFSVVNEVIQMGEDSAVARYAAEFVGTFMLIFTIGCNVLSGQPIWGGVSIACGLTVTIYALGSESCTRPLQQVGMAGGGHLHGCPARRRNSCRYLH